MLKFSFVDIFNFYLWGCIINITIVVILCIYDKSIKIMVRDWKNTMLFVIASYIGTYIFLEDNFEYWLEKLHKLNKTMYAVVITIIAKKIPNRKNMLVQYFDRVGSNKIRVTKSKMIRYFHKNRDKFDDWDEDDSSYFDKKWEYYGSVEKRFIRRYLKR
ncbi:hypothetical protein [Fusobacterium ulcerans]|uniref:hypothetical protein n=1 Tax=Fusobacterium ulcerans TaxID=861 RepID=UPI0030ADD3AA